MLITLMSFLKHYIIVDAGEEVPLAKLSSDSNYDIQKTTRQREGRFSLNIDHDASGDSDEVNRVISKNDAKSITSKGKESFTFELCKKRTRRNTKVRRRFIRTKRNISNVDDYSILVNRLPVRLAKLVRKSDEIENELNLKIKNLTVRLTDLDEWTAARKAEWAMIADMVQNELAEVERYIETYKQLRPGQYVPIKPTSDQATNNFMKSYLSTAGEIPSNYMKLIKHELLLDEYLQNFTPTTKPSSTSPTTTTTTTKAPTTTATTATTTTITTTVIKDQKSSGA